MNFLLDTHIFLWYITGSNLLKSEHREIIEDMENKIFVSTASLWEMIIKAKIGKLPLPSPYFEYIETQIENHNFNLNSIEGVILKHLELLPDIHKDPFDRILICQSIESKYKLITDDENILQYSKYNDSFLV